MKKYEIELNEFAVDFFERIADIVQRPIEELLSDALFKQTEIISQRISRFDDDAVYR